MWAIVLLATLIVRVAIHQVDSAPVPFKDELKANFNLNDQRLGEVGDLMDQIRAAADRRYKDSKTPTAGDKRAEANDNENSGAGGASLTVPSIGVGHPNFSLPLAKYLFEGDILLSPVQANSILHKLLMDSNRERRNRRAVVSSDLTARWRSFPIRYDFDSSINQADQTTITNALNFWGSNTCLSFAYQPGVTDGDYLNFFTGQGCYSMIGKQGGKQSVSLGDGCVQMGVITHEVGHALGLWHEQSRPDADGYVRIIPGNVITGLLYNFIQRSWSDVLTYSVPYDIGSVMHYGGTAFSIDYQKDTIETVKPGYQRTIGQREHPSFYDVKLINEAYNCSTSCSSQLPCQYGGYTHPDHCERCLCPDGLSGQYCEKPADSVNAQCGGLINVNNEEWTVINSPGYPQPGFVVGQECYWLIKSDPGTRILMQFLSPFQFICAVTCLDYVEVKNETDFGNTGMRFCCYTAPTFPIYSESNEMLIIFRSTYSKDVGFKAQLQQYPPGIRGGIGLTDSTDSTVTVSTNTVTQSVSRTSPTVTTVSSSSSFSTTVSRTAPTVTTLSTVTTSTTSLTTATEETTGNWNPWSAWSDCTRTCGACGVKTRSRQCGSTQSCYGERQQYKRCAFDICPSDTLCTRLQFGDEPCGKNKDKICSNAHEVTVKCSFPSCCDPFAPKDGYCRLVSWNNATYDSSWAKWSPWGDCLGANCGGCAIRARIRACEDDTCSGGTDTEYQRCNTQACTDCSKNPGQWIIGDCQNGRKDQCIRPRSTSETTCPCCPPLVNVNGRCVSP